MEFRVTFADPEEAAIAVSLLDKNGLDYDWDSGNRMMLDKNGLNLLNEASVDFDEV